MVHSLQSTEVVGKGWKVIMDSLFYLVNSFLSQDGIVKGPMVNFAIGLSSIKEMKIILRNKTLQFQTCFKFPTSPMFGLNKQLPGGMKIYPFKPIFISKKLEVHRYWSIYTALRSYIVYEKVNRLLSPFKIIFARLHCVSNFIIHRFIVGSLIIYRVTFYNKSCWTWETYFFDWRILVAVESSMSLEGWWHLLEPPYSALGLEDSMSNPKQWSTCGVILFR